MDPLRTNLISLAADLATPYEAVSGAVRFIEGWVPGEIQSQTGFLSDKDARKYAGCISRATLYLWRKRGLRYYEVGGRVLYLPADITDFIKRNGEKNENV